MCASPGTRFKRLRLLGLEWMLSPSARRVDEERRHQVELFERMVIVVFPLIFLVGIVTLPLVRGSYPLWTAPTFLPASVALMISVVSLGLSRMGLFRAAMLIYATMFVATPAIAVIQDSGPANLPVGTLMIGGALVITALFEEVRLPVVFVGLVVATSFLIPALSPDLDLRDAAALISANLTNGVMVVTYSFYRGSQERRRRKALQDAYGNLRDQQRLFTSLVSNIPGFLFRSSPPPERELRYLSENFTSVTGYPREPYLDFDARPLTDLVEKEDRGQLQARIANAMATGARYDAEYRIKNPSGEVRWLRETGRRVQDDDGAVWMDAIAIDITEAHHKDEQLRQAQKMESIGMLAGGLAHDFNNILAVIMGSVSLARFAIDHRGGLEPGKLDETIRQVDEAASRAKAIVDQLLSLSRPQEPTLTAVDLTQSIGQALALVSRGLDKSIQVLASTKSESAFIRADPVQIEQVLLNLCVNAAHAMTVMRAPEEPWGGTLGASLRKISPEPAFLEAHLEARAREYWMVSIRDTGVGIDDESRRKLFTPFFSTKEPGQGTGLGLSMVYSIVKSHDGFLSVESDPGTGSTFNLFFPVLEAEEAQVALDRREPELVRGTETILLVDDEESVRKVAARMLAECGYSVHTAADGEDAIRLLRARADGIDLVLLDLMMPAMSGREAFLQLRELAPHVPVLLTSGFRQDRRVQELRDEGVAFLDKPYTLTTLSRAIRTALGARETSLDPEEPGPAPAS